MNNFKNLNLKTVYQWPLRYQAGLFVIAMIITIFLGYWWDISSLELKLDTARQQEHLLKDEVASVIAKEQNAKKDISRLAATRMLLAQWKSQLVNPAKVPESLNELLKISGDSHLYVGLFDPGIEDDSGNYATIPLKMVVVGNYHQLSDFLSHAASLPWLVKITQLTFSSENKPDTLGKPLADQANLQNFLTAELHLEIGLLQQKPLPEKPAHAHK